MKRKERYFYNFDAAVKIAHFLGFELMSFDPAWTVIHPDGTPESISDKLMERLAILFGLPWICRDSSNEEKETREMLKKIRDIKAIKFSGEETKWLKKKYKDMK